MEYKVTVEADGDIVLQFEGSAMNPTDALYKAMEIREDQLAAKVEGRDE